MDLNNNLIYAGDILKVPFKNTNFSRDYSNGIIELYKLSKIVESTPLDNPAFKDLFMMKCFEFSCLTSHIKKDISDISDADFNSYFSQAIKLLDDRVCYETDLDKAIFRNIKNYLQELDLKKIKDIVLEEFSSFFEGGLDNNIFEIVSNMSADKVSILDALDIEETFELVMNRRKFSRNYGDALSFISGIKMDLICSCNIPLAKMIIYNNASKIAGTYRDFCRIPKQYSK